MKNCLSQDFFFKIEILWKHANCLLKHSLDKRFALKLYELEQKSIRALFQIYKNDTDLLSSLQLFILIIYDFPQCKNCQCSDFRLVFVQFVASKGF